MGDSLLTDLLRSSRSFALELDTYVLSKFLAFFLFVNSKPLWRQLMTVRQHKMMDEPSEKTWIIRM